MDTILSNNNLDILELNSLNLTTFQISLPMIIMTILGVICFSYLFGKYVPKLLGYEFKGITLALGGLFSSLLMLLVIRIIESSGYTSNIDGILGIFLVLIPILISICIIDLKYFEIPDEFNFIILILGLLFVALTGNVQNLLSGVILFILFFALAILFQGGIGGGDVKMVLGLGMFIPFGMSIVTFLLVTFIAGALLSTFLVLSRIKSAKDVIPFGPFLILGYLYCVVNLVL